MLSAGVSLRKIRDRLGLTMRDVEHASLQISRRHASEEYLIPPSRLSDIETKGVVPSIFRIYSLAAIYRRPLQEFLGLYGIETGSSTADWTLSQPTQTHVVATNSEHSLMSIPTRLDPAFDLRETSDLGRLIQQWGSVPFSFLEHLASQNFTYAFIGFGDYTMHPILQPGSFVQIDESKRRVVERTWHSEYERPIYFVETREGFCCCWCSVSFNALVLQPHPLSPVPVRVLKHPQEAEVIGQVVGVAMRLGPRRADERPSSRELEEQTQDGFGSASGHLRVANAPELPVVQTRKFPI